MCYLWYKGQVPQPYLQSQPFGMSDGSWRGHSYQQTPWMNGKGYNQGFPSMQNGQNQGFSIGPNGQFFSQGISAPSQFQVHVLNGSQFQVSVLNGSLIPPSLSY